MPRITFIEDVILPNEKEGTGPHYRRGYSPDVSDDEARRWVRSGKAVMGAVELPEAKKAAPDSSVTQFRKKRWRAPE